MKDDKYIFDDIALEKECYYLLSLYFASYKIRALKVECPTSQFHLFSIYESQEIKKLLISISIQLRIIDDLMRKHNRTNYITNDGVGKICFFKNNITKDATIRDACNKIIHTQFLNIITDDNPQVILKGSDSQNGEWEATIFIIKFIELALDLIKNYSEDWDVSANRA